MIWDHPRLRGEYKQRILREFRYLGSPPLTRGILYTLLFYPQAVGITPAYAGNTRVANFIQYGDGDHPRLRGEYSAGIAMNLALGGSPPLTRGILRKTLSNVRGQRITPAYAGNTLKESLIYSIFPLSATKFHLVSHTLEMS